jgi:hypothetical protein
MFTNAQKRKTNLDVATCLKSFAYNGFFSLPNDFLGKSVVQRSLGIFCTFR